MNDAERFLAAHTIECKPLHARISRTQCGTNIKNDIPQCTRCPERDKADMTGPEPVRGLEFGIVSKNKRPSTPEGGSMTQEYREYTWQQIADMAGVNRSNMTYALKLMESGKVRLPEKAAKIKAVMDKFGLSPADLRGRPKPQAGADATAAPEPAHAEDSFETEGAAMAACLTDTELFHLAESRREGTEPPGSIGRMISLEEVFRELKSRLPSGTTITIVL